MPRLPRIQIEGGWYHIINTGIKGKLLFPSEPLFKVFLSVLEQVHELYRVEIHAYCVLPGQYHLLIHTPENNLSSAMRHLAGVYAQHYNRITQSDGPIFKGRYKDYLIDADTLLARVTRYFHRLPVQKGIVDTAEEYHWSSYREYLGLDNSAIWLYTERTLRQICEHGAEKHCTLKACDCYRKYVESCNDYSLHRMYMSNSGPAVIGDDGFRKEICEKLCGYKDHAWRDKSAIGKPEISNIIEKVTEYYDIDPEVIFTPTNRTETRIRAIAMWLCRFDGGYSLKEISDSLDISAYSTISTAISRISKDVKVREGVASDIKNIQQLINRT